jgi:hypothetical protein
MIGDLLSSFVNCIAIGPYVDVVSLFLVVYDVTLLMMDDPMPSMMMIILLPFGGIMMIL